MFDLDAQVRRWREQQGRETSLSPHELEDHLRARVDLEMGLNAVRAPEQAFTIARRNLGEPVALSKEFAKAGRPRWRRWLLTGRAMYGASWFLPVIESPLYGTGTIQGYEVLTRVGVLRGATGGVTGTLLFFSNLAMLVTVPVLWRARPSAKRWFWGSVGAVGAFWIASMVGGLVFSSILNGETSLLLPPLLTVGFWTWTASYICVAAALRMRAKDGAPTPVRATHGFASGSRPGRRARCDRRSPAIAPDIGALQ